MPMTRVTMKKIREILRLKFDAKLSNRVIARTLGISAGAVSHYTSPLIRAGFEWAALQALEDKELENLLFPTKRLSPKREFIQPDFPKIHQELRKKTVTLQLLWEEYYDIHREKAYGRTQFCKMYQKWRNKLKATMRQVHKAGDKLFIDYAGTTIPIVDADGEIKQAQIFVAVMGASNYTYAEATRTQTLPDWIGSHVRAFSFFQGVPALIVPDNIKSAITRSCRYEPDANPTYSEMIAYYGTAVMPARPLKPRDKAKVEVGVQVVGRWILARLRHQRFFNLAELNQAIAKLLIELNDKPFKKLSGTRFSQFEAVDKPALRPLPEAPYVYADFKKARLGIDYHVEVEGHYYSAPYQLIEETVEVRYTERAVEIFHKSKRIASHIRSFNRGKHTTQSEHMPTRHQKQMKWTPGRLLNWGQSVGPYTLGLVKHMIDKKAHPEQAYRACLGLLNLHKQYGNERLEAACFRATYFGMLNRYSVLTILKKGLDRLPLPEEQPSPTPTHHQNIRGSDYFTVTT